MIGSFLNVCIYRIPRNESVVSPPSHCPNCGYKIKWFDNIPILSYFILLRGKCRGCGQKISIRYPLIEMFTGLLFLIVFYKYLVSIDTLKMFVFTSILIVLSFIDIKEYILPDRLTFSLIVLGFLSAPFTNTGIENAMIGAAVFSFPFMLLYSFGEDILKKEIMGFGDVKLAAGIGAFLGYGSFYKFYLFFMMAFGIGAVIGVLLIMLKIKSRKDMVPFGPFIALSGFILSIINV